MIGNKKVLAVIPARGGSKGLPRKNILKLAGKPLIAWTIQEARKSVYIDRLVLSSEDQEIIETAKAFGCEVPFIRPAEIARDETPGIEPVLHALGELPGYDTVVVLQPTSPLRTAKDIDAGLEYFDKNDALSCVSVSEVRKNPYWMFTLDRQNRMHPVICQDAVKGRRQDLPKVYVPNGALFIGDAEYLKEQKSFYTEHVVGYIMPRESGYDIDDEIDMMICEHLIHKHMEG